MAKQTGIHGLRGKVNGMSYYGSKVGGSLVRKINEGMSARVKTGKEYANTRKNNAEFGMCGDFAGAFIKPITLRWRFLLDSIATGKMVKAMREILTYDGTNIWGQRDIKSSYHDLLIEKFNSFSKNEMLSEIVGTIGAGVTFDEDGNNLALPAKPILSEGSQQELIDAGINHIQVKYFNLQASTPVFSSIADAYEKSQGSMVEIPALKVDVDITAAAPVDLATATSATSNFTPVVDGDSLGGLLVVYLPCRKVGNAVNVLQEYCAAYLFKVNPA